MRLESVVELEDKKVIVRELTPKIVRNFLTKFKEQGFDFVDLIENFGEYLGVLGDCIEIAEGKVSSLQDLSFSELRKVYDEFKKINDFFFKMILQNILPVLLTQEKALREHVSFLQKEGI